MEKVLIADFSSGKDRVTVRGLWQFDRGVKLKVIGINVTDVNRVDFAPVIASEAVPVVVTPDEDGTFTVSIPGAATKSPYDVTAYIYVDTADYGYTVKAVSMPVILRPEAGKPGEEEKPDPFGEVVEKVSGYAADARDSARAASESASKSEKIAEKVAVLKEQVELSAKNANASERAAGISESNAAESASQARDSATAARSAADEATESATTAAESETTAAQQAQNAAQSDTNAARSAESAQQAANSAAESASTATAVAQTATTAAGNAAESATSAAKSAEMASQKATAAETSASNAAESATAAEKSATAAGDSASAAKASETAAGEAAQTAQEQTKKIKDSAEQIEENRARVAAVIIEESATGADIVISDSAEMPLKNLKLFGKSTQTATTGKNLFDFSKIKNVGNQGTCDTDYDRMTITIPAKTNNVGYVNTMRELCPEAVAGKTYVLNCNTSNGEAGKHIYLLETKRAINFGKAFEWSDEMLDAKLAWYNNANTNNENVISEIQFEEGTVATGYEPYTHGKPSPSPDWPQEIISAGDSGNIEINVTGKNLVDIQNVETYWAHTLSVSVDELNKHVGDTVTVTGTFDVISVKSDKTSNRYEFRVSARNEDGSYTAYASKTLNTAPKIGDKIIVSKTVTVSKKIKSILLYGFGVDNIGTLGTSKATVQIELGGVATPYKPFEKETLNLITPTGLPGIPVDSDGNYTDENGQQWVCDEVDFERGVYVQRIGIADQDSFSTIIWTTGAICFVNLKANTLQTRYAMTTISAVYRLTWVPSSYATHFTQTLSQKLIIVLPNTITTKEQGEEIRQKGFKFAYILGKPIETSLSPEEIAAYKSLTTHKTTTLISNDAGAGMEVTYVADPKTYIDNKFAELSQAIVASASEAE